MKVTTSIVNTRQVTIEGADIGFNAYRNRGEGPSAVLSITETVAKPDGLETNICITNLSIPYDDLKLIYDRLKGVFE